MKMPRKKAEVEEPESWLSMASTQAQRFLLKSLGVSDVRGLTRGEASEMIDRLRPDDQTPLARLHR